ncbi:hypothetical protein ABZU53_29615 [Micromonospora sp. NPDC005194]|uniref:hypothetical protein n=1 Tax=Micromonospora sp. NPDC005194 TaxID=3156870 RepID=UPI00339E0CED
MAFLPGLVLARRYHDEVVAPILRGRLPDLRYAAGLLDGGSEVLGLDTARSTDHDWGPRVQVFVGLADVAAIPRMRAVLDPTCRRSSSAGSTGGAAVVSAGRVAVRPGRGVDADRTG